MTETSIKTQMLNRIRATGRSEETFKTYWYWCEKYIGFLKQNAEEFNRDSVSSREKVERWLSMLANGKEWVSKNTQNLALQSVCYLYREVLKQPLKGINALRSKRPDNVREVVDQSELVKLFAELRGVGLLAAQLMYGCGLRIGDVVKIRIKDISFERRQIHIHSGKGDKSRYVSFPEVLHEPVKAQIESMRTLHSDDVRQGLSGVSLPDGFGRKCKSAHLQFAWWYLFSSDNYSKCPRSGNLFRHHRDKSHIGRVIKDAVAKAGIDKRITSHCLRLRTTEIYVHANKDRATASKSPIENLMPQSSSPFKLRIVG